MDDYDFDKLHKENNVYIIAATCGQGEYPGNSKMFWKALSDKDLPSDHLANVKFTTFGLGDSSYVFFNSVAVNIDDRFAELGASRICERGLGDDKDDERFETVYSDWAPDMFSEAGLPTPPDVLLPASYALH